jgi:MFS family permease
LGSVYSSNLMRFYAVVFFQIAADTGLYLAVPLYSHSLGINQIEVGLISAIYWAAQIPSQPYFGKFTTMKTQRRLLLAGVGGQCILTLFFPLSRGLWGLLLIRFLQGIFSSAFWMATRYVAAEEAPRPRVGAVMGMYGVSMGLAGMVGPTLAGYSITSFGFIPAFLSTALFSSLAFLPMWIRWKPRKKAEGEAELGTLESTRQPSKEDRRNETRILWIACLPLFIWGMGAGMANSIFPVYLNILTFPAATIGLIQMMRSGSLMSSQWLGGRLSDRFSRTMLATLGVAFSVTLGAIPLVNSFAGFGAVIFAASFGVGVSYTAGLTLIAELSSKRKGIGFGLFGSASTAGLAFGSQVGGAIAQYVTLTAPYYFAAAISAVTAIVLYYLHRKASR